MERDRKPKISRLTLICLTGWILTGYHAYELRTGEVMTMTQQKALAAFNSGESQVVDNTGYTEEQIVAKNKVLDVYGQK